MNICISQSQHSIPQQIITVMIQLLSHGVHHCGSWSTVVMPSIVIFIMLLIHLLLILTSLLSEFLLLFPLYFHSLLWIWLPLPGWMTTGFLIQIQVIIWYFLIVISRTMFHLTHGIINYIYLLLAIHIIMVHWLVIIE